jgi:hypothetical protein
MPSRFVGRGPREERVRWTSALKPGVSKRWLLVLAGFVWSGVGVMLCRLAYGWLRDTQGSPALLLGLSGAVAALGVYRFGFVRVARRNMERIDRSVDNACVFSFQSWRGYLIVAVMVTLGVTLRHSAIPRPVLAVLYAAIGGGLFLASLHYYVHFRGGRTRGDL